MSEPAVDQTRPVRSQDVSVIIYPEFPDNTKGRVFAGRPFRSIVADEDERLIENVVSDVVLNAGRTVIGILSGHPITFRDRFPAIIQNVAQLSKRLSLPPLPHSSPLILSNTSALSASS